MSISHKFPPALPALPFDPAQNALLIAEGFGLEHEHQVLTVTCPPNLATDISEFHFQDIKTGRALAAQRSRQNPDHAFIALSLSAGESYQLKLQPSRITPDTSVTIISGENSSPHISNGKWAAEIFLGEWQPDSNAVTAFTAPAPIRRISLQGGPWRGSVFFDTRQPIRRAIGHLLEEGPLRVVSQFQAWIGEGRLYSCVLTFDAGADFIRVDESFDFESGDQIVWDFAGKDLPEKILLLDSSAGFDTLPLTYFFDRRIARLACWNQYSQLHDYSDGYALTFPQSSDVIGYIALRGGSWSGNSHNFLEGWVRRWLPNDPGSRRLVPAEMKADASPSPERISTRPANSCESHFSVEGWLQRGTRHFALLITSRDHLRNKDWHTQPSLGPFEKKPAHTRYRQQQSLLRRIHTQYGMLSLPELLALPASWSPETSSPQTPPITPPWENPDHFHEATDLSLSIPQRIDQILEFLEARVFGFWNGSGSAYTNAVISRRLAPDLADWEWLVAHNHLKPDQLAQGRAWFALLAHLFSSDNFYPGAAAMGDPDKNLEPTIAGMANQNFFTDTFNFPGMAAQVFRAHPEAPLWRDRFTHMWKRQLDYHVYPESGVWEESHTYYHHVLQTVIPTLERRLADGVDNSFADPAFQKLVGSALKLLTPKDACFGDKRHVVAFGDHGVDLNDFYRPLYRNLAKLIAPFNPKLAAQLAWAYREMGGLDPQPISPDPMPWQSEAVQGLGYFFRAQHSCGESLLALRCGSSWAHHHNDDGSIQFFCAGRAWIVDSAFSYPQKNGIRKFRTDGHSRWSPQDFAPLNYLWQFNRGWITHHQESAPFPHATAFTPVYMAETSVQQYIPLRRPIQHWRTLVQLSPRAFLLFDYTDMTLPQAVRFHIPVDAPLNLEGAPSSLKSSGESLHIRALFGLQSPQIIATDEPVSAGENFNTREILYSGAEPLSALFIEVAKNESAATIRNSVSGAIEIHHTDFEVALRTLSSEQITLTDLKTGQTVPISLTTI